MTFSPFDPLLAKNTLVNEAALAAVRRELENIMSSYVGWYDPFSELIQNALDAVDARQAVENRAGTGEAYQPKVTIEINVDDNSLTVTDNGTGLGETEFQQFLAPSFSFKKVNGGTRGHKGVGATYIAYGFNYMRISTKSPGFEATGRIIGARDWLRGNGSAENPKVEPDAEGAPGAFTQDRGVSITVRFDESTTPGKLSWLKADTAQTWMKILSVKTAVGSVTPDDTKTVQLNVVSDGKRTTATKQGTAYLWLHESAAKAARLRDIDAKADELYLKFGSGRKLPDKFNKLDFIYDQWTSEELENLVGKALDDEDRAVIEKFKPTVAVEFGYTAKFWTNFNRDLGIRAGQVVLTSGIQMAANNMPQGETIQIPLIRNIGRQNQLHFLFHFDNYTPDLGRKGFHRELTEFAKRVARAIAEGPLSKRRAHLKANTGASPDLARELAISDWKDKLILHEATFPLQLKNPHFFAPTQSVSITSVPTREQDVIALFHELIAGGVVRGIAVMSTNEHSTYDGLFRISFALDPALYLYEADKNPLGVSDAVLDQLKGIVTKPRVLEYKFSLDGLIEDFDNNDKNINDIDLCIAWDTGSLYESRYAITSVLTPENADQRQYHGVTHVLQDLETGNKHCDLIILSELIDCLEHAEEGAERQRVKYE